MAKGIFTSNSYSSVHKWLSRNFKKSKKCDFCGSTKFIEWALKKPHKHSHIRNHYLCLCSSCHKVYDYTEERKKKLSASLRQVIHTEEWNKKATAHNKTFRHDDKAKEKMRINRLKNPFKKDKKTGRFLRKNV